MSFRVWPTETESVDLGNPFVVLRVFGEIGALPGAHDDLNGIVHADDQELSPEYVHLVAAQARALLDAHDDELSADAREVLAQIAGMADSVEVP